MVAITLTPKIKNLDKLLAHCHRRRYTAKSTIIYAGDRCETLFFIVKGSVTILIEDDDGHEMIIAYLNNGDFFGELGLFEPVDGEQQRIGTRNVLSMASAVHLEEQPGVPSRARGPRPRPGGAGGGGPAAARRRAGPTWTARLRPGRASTPRP